jgi:hypothetical protein
MGPRAPSERLGEEKKSLFSNGIPTSSLNYNITVLRVATVF